MNVHNWKNLFFALILINFFGLNFSHLYAGEESLYNFRWMDPDKNVHVLQNKLFEKKNTLYLNLGYGMNLSNDFQDEQVRMVKTGYFLWEEWGFELLYASLTNKNSATLQSISIVSESIVPFIRKTQNYYGGSLIFSPFYAKINTFNKIFYLDWNFGLGLVKLNTESNRTAFKTNNRFAAYQKESFTGYLLQTELRFYLTEYMHANANLLKIYYKDQNPSTNANEYFSTTDLVFSLGFCL